MFPACVKEICEFSFSNCKKLQSINFSMNSQLVEIKSFAFSSITIKKMTFPKSLKVIRSNAFRNCSFLEQVNLQNIERIEAAFGYTAIRRLTLPLPIKEIGDVSHGMDKLEKMYVSNELFESNSEGYDIFSKDVSELICVIKSMKRFNIPDNVRVIKQNVFKDSKISDNLLVPASVEVIEAKAFKNCDLKVIKFAEGSKLKFIEINSLPRLGNLIIKNANFIKNKNGSVMSSNPRGIVFVPKKLKSFEIDQNVEVIYSNAFIDSKIKYITIPRSIKKICSRAFYKSMLESVIFQDLISLMAYFHLSRRKLGIS